MNPGSAALVDHYLTSIRKQLDLNGSARERDPHGLSIGRLMLSMAQLEGGRGAWALGGSLERFDVDTKAEWRRADENALMAPQSLTGPGGFAAQAKNRRDCALIDWDWLRYEAMRAMGTPIGAKGGFLVGADSRPIADPLWQDSIIGAAGVQTLEGLTNNVQLPRGSAVTVAWQAGDGTAPTAIDASLGAVSVVAKTLLATVQCSVTLIRQGGAAAQDFLARLLLRSARQALDTALLQGSGAVGQPMGLSNLPTASGIQQVSGTSLAWSGILNAQKLASTSGVTDSRMVWVGAPTVRETLGQRERVTTAGRFLWEDGRIAGNVALATPDAPASTLFVGDFSAALLALFGNGLEIRFDPNNDFNKGLVAYQLLGICDLVFPQPSAFVRVASIT